MKSCANKATELNKDVREAVLMGSRVWDGISLEIERF